MAQLVKNPSGNAGEARDTGSVPVLGRSPGGGNDNPLQYACLENSMNRSAWWATFHGVAKRLHSSVHTHTEDNIHILIWIHIYIMSSRKTNTNLGWQERRVCESAFLYQSQH